MSLFVGHGGMSVNSDLWSDAVCGVEQRDDPTNPVRRKILLYMIV